MMLNDFECKKHGIFEGSHPICPAMGCDSSAVKRVFVKAPAVKSDMTKRTDAGMRKSAEMYGQSDWKSAKEGESAKANNRSNEVKWGAEAAAFLGGDLSAALPRRGDGIGALGMVQENHESGAANKLASAERTGVKKQDDAWAGQLAAVAREARTK